MSSTNYAEQFGIQSVPAAAVFAAIYVPLFIWFLRQSIKRPTHVYFTLSLFCAIRITAYTIRAILAGSSAAGGNFGLLTGDEVLFSVGFFGLLYSAYTLVLDREALSNTPPRIGLISRIVRNRELYRLAMIVAIALGISGLSMIESSDTGSNTGNGLHKASTIIFLVLVALLVYQTLILAKLEISTGGGYKHTKSTFGAKYGIYILLLISILLLIREAFATATMGDLAKQNNEHFWYPLVAVPEVLAALLYTIPNLIPTRAELHAAASKSALPK